MTTLGLDRLPDRCVHGFAAIQHPALCACSTGPADEWAIFTAALSTAARDGLVHQGDVRRIIRGRIEPKHIGTLYRRARSTGLLTEVDHERSDDVAGRNSGRLEPVYKLRDGAALARTG